MQKDTNKNRFSGFKFEERGELSAIIQAVEDIKLGKITENISDSRKIGEIHFPIMADITLNKFSSDEIIKKHGDYSAINIVETANNFEVLVFIKALTEDQKDKVVLVKVFYDGYFILGANRYNGYGVVTLFEKHPWDKRNKKYLESLLRRGISFASGRAADPSSSLKHLEESRARAVNS